MTATRYLPSQDRDHPRLTPRAVTTGWDGLHRGKPSGEKTRNYNVETDGPALTFALRATAGSPEVTAWID
jgi:hypothetical protein